MNILTEPDYIYLWDMLQVDEKKGFNYLESIGLHAVLGFYEWVENNIHCTIGTMAYRLILKIERRVNALKKIHRDRAQWKDSMPC